MSKSLVAAYFFKIWVKPTIVVDGIGENGIPNMGSSIGNTASNTKQLDSCTAQGCLDR